MLRVDLNCDLGEGFGHDEALLGQVSSANIACGFHAGNPNVMARTVSAAATRDVALGAHPGLPDLEGFGRRALPVSEADVYDITLYQIGALAAFARAQGRTLRHVKPHGALYHMAEADPSVARALARAIQNFDASLTLFGCAGGKLVQAGRDQGLRVAGEAFVDRAYLPNGALAPRSALNAVLHDPAEAARRAVRLVTEGKLTAVDGTELVIQAETLCVHGDEPSALAVARAVRAALEQQKIAVRPPGDL